MSYFAFASSSTSITYPTPTLPSREIGVNLSGGEFAATKIPGKLGTDYVWPTSTEINYYDTKGFTLARIPFLPERICPTIGGGLNATYRDALLATVDAVRAKGMWAMLDLHGFWRYNGALITEAQLTYIWTQLAVAVGTRDKVILGLMNEPNGVPATTVVAVQNTVINAIRAAGYVGVIAVSGTAYSGAHSWVTSGNAAAFTALVPDPGVIFDIHQYLDADGAGDTANCVVGSAATLAGDGVFRLSPFTTWARANGRKALLGEWSFTPGSTNCDAWAPGLLDYLRTNSDVWCGHAYWANFPTAFGPWDSNPQLLNPLTGGADRPQIDVLIPPVTAGDRLIYDQRVFPSAMFASFTGTRASPVRVPSSGRIIDVTAAPFNATGNGSTDDTAAIVAAINYVKSVLERSPARDNPDTNFVLYFPGNAAHPKTYLCTDEVTWTGSFAAPGEHCQYWRVVGEDRRYSTIRLKPNSTGFGAGANKAFLNLAKEALNALETKNTIDNITISIGAGNPGCTAVRFGGANGDTMGNFSVVFEDGKGKYGLWLQDVSQFWIHDVTFTGGQYAVGGDGDRSTCSAFEHITISGQSIAGADIGDNSMVFRDLYSDNLVPAVQLQNKNSSTVIVESTFVGGAVGAAAIQVNGGGCAFVRECTRAGSKYSAFIKEAGTTAVAGNTVTEWRSGGKTYSLFGSASATSIKIPPKESPTVLWPDASEWAVVTNNNNADVQAAFNSAGKRGVMFKNFQHGSIGAIDVPANIEYIYGAYSTCNGLNLTLRGSTTKPLIVHCLDNTTVKRGSCRRPVVLQESAALRYQNPAPDAADELYMNAISGLNQYALSGAGQKVFIRMSNTEPKGLPSYIGFDWNNCKVWVLTYKCEMTGTNHNLTGGTAMEVLGGFANQTPFDKPSEVGDQAIFEMAAGSQLSASMFLSGSAKQTLGYLWFASATKGGVTKRLAVSALPDRPAYPVGYNMPLYVEDLTSGGGGGGGGGGAAPAEYPVLRTSVGTRTGAAAKVALEAGEFVRTCGCLMQQFDSMSVSRMIEYGGLSSRTNRGRMEANGAAIYQLKDAGIKFLIHGDVFNQSTGALPATPAQLLSTVKKYGVDLFYGVSGPNEPNSPHKIVDSVSYWQYLRDYQQTLFETFRADPVTRDTVKILSPGWRCIDTDLIAGIGDIDAWVDGHEIHTYATSPFPPERSTMFNVADAAFGVADPAKPVFVGEVGYNTDPTTWAGKDPVAYKDRFMPRQLLYHFDHGVAACVVYLMTNTSDGSLWSTGDDADVYGWIKPSGLVQPSYTSVQNLIALLQDPGPRFTTTNLNFTISGATSNLMYTLMQKRSGRYYLAVWVGTYDNDTRAITINLPASISSARLARPNTDRTWTTQPISANTITYVADGYVSLFELW